MTDYLIKRPMLLCAVISTLICVGGYYSKNALLFIGILIISIIFFMLYKRLSPTVIFSLLFALAVVFRVLFQFPIIDKAVSVDGSQCRGEYIVIEEPQLMGEYYVTTLETERSEFLQKGTKVKVVYYKGDISLADYITADIFLESLESSSYKLSSYSENVFLRGYAENIKQNGKTEFILRNIAKLRNFIKQKIFKNYSFNQASTMLALVTGDNSCFSHEFYSNLKRAGVTHIMVVSGMHLSVIVAFLLTVAEKFFYNKYFKAFVIFVAVLTVSMVCGFTMSIMRAGITYLLIAFSLLIERPNTPTNTLGTAVCFILLSSPFAIFNVAFQLSVLSTFGILAVAVPVSEYIKENELIKNKILLKLIGAVLISLSAAIMTAPIVIYCFGYISNVLLITNLLVCFPSTLALVLGIIGIILPIFSEPFFLFSNIIIKFINWVINYFGNLPFSITVLPKFFAFLATVIIIVVLWGLLACKKRIDMLKLNKVYEKKIKEGGKSIKWLGEKKNLQTKKH